MDKIYLRECIECKQFLPIGEFYASIDKKTGREARYSRCKKCLAKRRMDVATGKIVPKGKHLDPEK